jgi:hypothetical protein
MISYSIRYTLSGQAFANNSFLVQIVKKLVPIRFALFYFLIDGESRSCHRREAS